jgi:hypothetical protein
MSDGDRGNIPSPGCHFLLLLVLPFTHVLPLCFHSVGNQRAEFILSRRATITLVSGPVSAEKATEVRYVRYEVSQSESDSPKPSPSGVRFIATISVTQILIA